MIGERIRIALTSKKISINKLSKELEMNQSTLNNQIREVNPLTAETIEKVLPYINNVSAEWLLRGEGAMEKGIVNQLIGRLGSCGDGDVFQSVGGGAEVETLRAQVAELKEEKKRLLDIIDKLMK